MPLLEPETIVLRLKEMGCPYSVNDEVRSVVWLEGYEAGYTKASTESIAHLKKLVNRG